MSRERILFVSARLPFPVVGGDRLRATQIGKALKQKYEVDLLCLTTGPLTDSHRAGLSPYFDRVFAFRHRKLSYVARAVAGHIRGDAMETAAFEFGDVRRWLRANSSRYAAAYCHIVRTAAYANLLPVVRVIDLADAISKHYKEASKVSGPLWNLYYRTQATRLLAAEGKALANFPLAFASAPDDARWLADHFPNESGKIIVSPVGVPQEWLDRQSKACGSTGEQAPAIGFVGKMNYRPNEDAAVHFARQIFPLIKRQIAGATFRVIGAYPTRRVLALADLPGVSVTGEVPDTSEYLGECAVSIAPLRIGGGIQNKVLQSMALAVPVVASTRATRGTGGTDGKHFIVADPSDPEAFAGAVVGLLGDHDRRRVIGASARQLVAERYTWDRVAGQAVAEIDRLIAGASIAVPHAVARQQPYAAAVRRVA